MADGATTCVLAAPAVFRHTLTDDPGCLDGGSTDAVGPDFLGPVLPFSVLGTTTLTRGVHPLWGDHEPVTACAGTPVDQRSWLWPQGKGCSPGAIEVAGCGPVPCDIESVGRDAGGEILDPDPQVQPTDAAVDHDGRDVHRLFAELRPPIWGPAGGPALTSQ